ncbi:hypothetical protein KFE25_000445 [Diacronema lutheri]|uniref:Uncharacterized protein n=1 Tax=Diacronema lutheri TaxID=2081491 RepID=A0A8J5XNT2_DIALT|nr:hypothetical protein KFE25_000445 [Diacronema lutheri]
MPPLLLLLLLLLLDLADAARRVSVWREGTPLRPSSATDVLLLPNCSVARAFVASLPAAGAPARAWRPWRAYVDEVYGEPAAGLVSVADFNVFFGVALRWPPTVPDQLACGAFTLFTTFLAAHRSPRPSLVVRRPAERYDAANGSYVEVYRSSHYLAPEGVGYGCWFYMARGTGAWVHAGATRVVTRQYAGVAWGLLADARARGTRRRVTALAPRGGFLCVTLESPAAEPLCVGSADPRAASDSSRAPNEALRIGPELCTGALRSGGDAASTAGAPRRGALYALPVADGTWPLTARRLGLDSLQVVPTTRPGHAEIRPGPCARRARAPTS